jgi:protein-disulfide isomerase
VLVVAAVHTAGAQPRRPDPALTYAIPVDGFPGDGPADAKVTLVVAHGYADPYSAKNRATLDELRKKYNQDLRVVFRNVVVHMTKSYAAALASCAAHKQKKWDLMDGKLWEAFHQQQFDTHEVDLGNGPQKCWDTPDGCPIVVGIAKDLGLRVDRFKADMQACVPIVNADMQEMQQQFAINATPSFFINGRYLGGAMPTPQFEAIVDEELKKATDRIKQGTPKARYYKTWVIDKGVKKVDTTAQPAMPRRPGQPDPAKTYAVRASGPARGPADAKVTIVQFFDYATPYAERARATLDDLLNKYGKDLRVVYRTRLVHPQTAMASALGMCAAAKQNRFGAMDDALWEKFKARALDKTEVDLGNGPQKCWDTPTGCTYVLEAAHDARLAIDPFKSDMRSCVATVQDDDAEGQRFGVNGTPTFFVNGRYLQGAQPIESFSQLIDEELAKASDRIKKGTPKGRYYQTWVVDRGEKSLAP